MAGTVIARKYRLLDALDAGSMGAVYAAEKIGTGERVAVKMLLPEFHGAQDLVERFLAEARASQRLVHPNIVRVFDYGMNDDNTPFIVMELLIGVPVSAYLRDGQHIPLGHATHIITGLLAGLGHAHHHSIIHRDLKPANVFLARGAQGKFEVKVLDFGIAKVMDIAGGMGSRTKTGIFLGTPAYMSPEQIVKPKTVDARSDLWSVGVMMYKMVTGKPPFGGVAEVDRLASILHDTPEPVEQIDPQLEP
ncbi:MAG: serine/threonine protein kinase, partial [Polyangiaceae bacterium]